MKASINGLLIGAIALALTAGAANAAHKKKRLRYHHPAVTAQTAPDPYARYYLPGPRPVWAAPWQCFTDEGYGRYRPCEAGFSIGH